MKIRTCIRFLTVLCLILSLAFPAAAEWGLPDSESTPLFVGQVFTFGRFEQDGNPSNGPEPIEWRVLEVDAYARRALVISVRSLTGAPYNAAQTDVTWENCSLRQWLNDSFLQTAFNETEQWAVPGSWISNGSAECDPACASYGGNDTWDRVFLLSYREANACFDGRRMDAKREAYIDRLAAPTRFARAQGAYCPEYFRTESGEYAGWWWLRSPGRNQAYAIYVDNNGEFQSIRVNKDTGGVRPAMWIDLDALIL